MTLEHPRPELPNPELDATHGTQGLAELVTAIFRDKTLDPGDAFAARFDKEAHYSDVVLGFKNDFEAISASMGPFTARWPDTARAYPTRVLGDENSAIVFFVDEPALFGNEVRITTSINFRHGKILRQVDYSDGRHFGADAISRLSQAIPGQFRTPVGSFPPDLGEKAAGETASPLMRDTCASLSTAFSGADFTGAAAMFAPDAVLEDLTLHTQIVGRRAITGFLQDSLALLPYGAETRLRHVVGSNRGGGYEWVADGGDVRNGIVALEIGEDSLITRLTTMWDGSLLDDDELIVLLKHTIER
jgi:hypothetical protein